MVDDLNIKKNIGKLGLYMIDSAQQEINSIQRKTLFQKAELRKDYDEKTSKQSKKIRSEFILKYNEIVNKALASSLIESKSRLLSLKNELINDFRINFKKEISTLIKERYENYIGYILNLLSKIKSSKDVHGEIEIYFNSRDYKYFSTNISKIKQIFNKSFKMEKSVDDHTGGFRIYFTDIKMNYDFTFDSLISKNFAEIEIEFSKLISDEDYELINRKFERSLNNYKKEIERYLRDYDTL